MMWLEHHEAGHRIFSLHPMLPSGECACGRDCGAAGKHPVSTRWQESPRLSDEAVEEAQSSGAYAHGYGVLVAGLIVVDVDARNGGVESLARLEQDLDVQLGALAGYVVGTGSGGGSHHLYYEAPAGVSLVSRLERYPGIDFKTSGYVVGCGSLHHSGDRYELWAGSPHDISPAPTELVDALRRRETVRARIGSVVSDVSIEDMADALNALDPDLGYEDWIRCGMALHDATQGADAGFDLWNTWSARGDKYAGPSAMDRHWHSFGKATNPVTVGTLFMMAIKAGWLRPAHLIPSRDEEAPASYDDGLPVDIRGVDILRPPGFVGELAEWIDKRNIFYRPRLAVAAALVSIGNLGGLRWQDDITRATANLFAFCVAASATGKDSVINSMTEIHRAAGVAVAVHGEIKSAQEITRNLIRNQAAYYIADEFGEKLSTIIGARRRGGTPYLEAILGDLMKIYSKAGGSLLISGDMKEAMRDIALKEMTRIERRLDSDPSPALEAELEEARAAMRRIDMGIERPFLSLIGFSTPSIFSDLMTFEQATSGFLGRAVLIHEPNTNPLPRDPAEIVYDMPQGVRATLQMIAHGGSQSEQVDRVEEVAPRRGVMTEPAAAEALRAVQLWTYSHLAEDHREKTGLEAVARRSYELIAKVSLILAIPSGVRTMEHVVWATAYALEDIKTKVRAIYAQDSESTHALSATILGVLSDEPVTLGVICNAYALRNQPRGDVLDALGQLVDAGRALKGERQDRRSKTKTVAVWSKP